MNETKCPVCKQQINRRAGQQGNNYYYQCDNCGDFGVTSNVFYDYLEFKLSDEERALFSHEIRMRHDPDVRKTPLYSSLEVDAILVNHKLPNIIEQGELWIRYLGETLKFAGDQINSKQEQLLAIVGARNVVEIQFILSHLAEIGLITQQPLTGLEEDFRYGLTYDGWREYQKAKKETSTSNQAFVAMQYNDEHLNLFVAHHFKTAIETTGFDMFILGENPKGGSIDNRMRAEIRRSKFLIADLSHDNLGAYWEAGFAEGVGLEVIYTCEKSKFNNIHFDVNHSLVVAWDSTDPDDFIERMVATIRATLPEYTR